MKIGINTFLDLFYSIMLNDEIDSINILDIVETVKILYASQEFDLLSSRLNLNEFTEEQINDYKYTKEIDEYGIVYFDIPDKEITKILSKNKVDAGLLQQAINKRAMVKLFNSKTEGIGDFKYDDPNGIYNLHSNSEFDNQEETKLYTDGNIVVNNLYKSNDLYEIIRTLKVENATFTLLNNTINNKTENIEIRGLFSGDYSMYITEALKVMKNMNSSFEEVIDKSPKVYKLKRN